MAELKYEIIRKLGVISVNKKTGWKKEFNIISWNDKKPKFDIREWGNNRDEIGKGSTFSLDEIDAIFVCFLQQERIIRRIIEPGIYLSNQNDLD